MNRKVEKSQEVQKGYDISQILSVSRGDQGFVQTMIKMFVVQTPIYIGKIAEHFKNGNLTEMGEEAHKLKPSIYAMGMIGLKKSIAEIISAGRKNELSEDLEDHINILKDSTLKVIEELKTDFGI